MVSRERKVYSKMKNKKYNNNKKLNIEGQKKIQFYSTAY